jgi:hypothetical protein
MQPSGYPRVMPARAFTFLSVLALMSCAAAPACLAESPPQPRTLNWFAKAQTKPYSPPQPIAPSTPAPVQQANALTPPSPYGRVGDPFVRRLNWQSKHAIAPVYTRPEAATPVPVTYTPPPEPARRPSVIMPPLAPAPALPLDLPPPAPQPAKPAPVAQPEPHRDGAYQIPQTSKYYRGTQAPEAITPAPAKPQATLAPAEQAAPAEQGFTPGQVMTDARTQSPRIYSLHRQYGLQPDAISSIDDNAPKTEPQPTAPTAKP